MRAMGAVNRLIGPMQLGYATTDLDHAMEIWAEDFNATKFFVREAAPMAITTASGPKTMELRLAFAYVNGLMIELIEPVGGDIETYAEVLPEEGFGTVLHHTAFLLNGDLSEWDDLRDWMSASGHPVVLEGAVEDQARFAYLDTRSRLGHHLEYIWWSKDRHAWMDDLPRF